MYSRTASGLIRWSKTRTITGSIRFGPPWGWAETMVGAGVLKVQETFFFSSTPPALRAPSGISTL